MLFRSNLRWALSQRPDDGLILERLETVSRERSAGRATVPSTIALERSTNLFVRSESVAELDELRSSRNDWNG